MSPNFWHAMCILFGDALCYRLLLLITGTSSTDRFQLPQLAFADANTQQKGKRTSLNILVCPAKNI